METANRQLLLAANLMARPELTTALFPPTTARDGADLTVLDNRTARSAVSVLITQGKAFASANAMAAALKDLPIELEDTDVIALLDLVPDPTDVSVEQLFSLRDELMDAQRERKVRASFAAAATSPKPTSEVVLDVEREIQEYAGSSVGYDPTATGISDRTDEGEEFTIRYKMGCELLDRLQPGVGPNNEPSYGVVGKGEMIVCPAMYGTGKTRLWLNGTESLLAQGASGSWIAGEDTAGVYSRKLMAIKFDLEYWMIEQYLVGKSAFISERGVELAQRIEEARSWFRDLGSQLRIYDRKAKKNIYRFPEAVSLLEDDVFKYGADFVIIDYAQIWKGETKELEAYAQRMLEFAARRNVCVIVLSQIPNDAMKFEPGAGQLPTKGTGEWGQAAHTGFLLTKDPVHGQEEVKIAQQKGRNAGETFVYANFNVYTGKIKSYYGTSQFNEPELPATAKKGKRR